MNHRYLSFMFCIISLVYAPCFMQSQTKKVSAEIVYDIPETESRADALDNALEEAHAEAIRRTFGSETGAKWVNDTKSPYIRYYIDSITGETSIFVEVCGKAKRVTKKEISLRIDTKRCLESGHCNKTTSFREGDILNIDFFSPVAGYLAVYLQDEDNNMFRLLPSVLNNKGSHEVKANMNYRNMLIPIGNGYIELIAFKPVEYNQLHFIFSPNPFTIPEDEEMDNELRYLEYSVYESWLARNRSRDNEMQVKTIEIEIRK